MDLYLDMSPHNSYPILHLYNATDPSVFDPSSLDSRVYPWLGDTGSGHSTLDNEGAEQRYHMRHTNTKDTNHDMWGLLHSMNHLADSSDFLDP